MKKTWQKLDQKEAFGTIVNTEDPKQYIAMHFSPKLYGSLLAHKALCGPLAQRSGRHPHVCIFVPILILSRSEFGSQQARPGFCILIKAETLL